MSDSERVYGNIQAPRLAKTLGLSMASIVLALTGAIVTFLLMQLFGIPIYFAVIALLVAGAGILFIEMGRKQGRTRVERAVAKIMFRRAKKAGATRYVSGPASRMPDGSHRAPGMLASTVMTEGVDHFGRPFGFLWDPMDRTGTVFFTAAAAGRALQDQESIDFLVSGWGGFLQQTGSLASLLQVTVTVTTVRDAGERLPAAVEDARSRVVSGEVQEFARSMVDEIVDSINRRAGRVDARIALTFSALPNQDEGLDGRSLEDLRGEVMVHMPSMIEQLELAGGGTVSYLRAQDVIDSTYVAYNPEAAVAVERARLSGAGTGLTWHEVGPSHASAERGDRYEHGAGFSQTFQVWKAPAGLFRENSLEAIMRPDNVSEQKRVTILYRLMSPEQSQKRVESAVADAMYESNQNGTRTTGAQLANAGRARRTEEEVSAQGSILARFSFLITVTVLEEDALRRVPSMVRGACQTGVQLSLRDSFANEDAAFALALGLGIVPAPHATISPDLRQAL